MAKVDLDIVKAILQRNELEVRRVNSILEDIEREMEILKEENPPAPPVKKQFVIMLSDPEGELPDKDLTGWVLQIPEEENVLTTEERIHKGAYDFNQTPKGRRLPATSIGEACEVVPPRIFKEYQLWVKTREPVLVLKTDNKIPTDTSGLGE